MQESVMTKNGYETLKEQLRKMKTVDRQEIIKEIEQRLAGAQVIDPAMISSDKIAFGATVVLEDEDRGGEVTYQIVGLDEADVDKGKISVSSPIARALIGRSVDDLIEVKTPGGVRSYTVLHIRFE